MQTVFPVRINSLGTVKQIGFSLAYDPSLLFNPQVSLGSGISGTLTASYLTGFVGVKVDSATIPAGQGVLVNITFDLADSTSRNNADIATLVWDKVPVYPVIKDANGNSLSWGANTGIVHMGTGQAESLNIDILGESAAVPVVTPAPEPVTVPVPVTPNPINTTVPPAPIITGGDTATTTPTPVTATTPTATATSELSTLLTGFSLTSILANHTALLLGGGAALFFLTRKKKRTRKF